MKQGYSFKKSFRKGIVSILTVAIAGTVFLGIGETQLWDLIVTHLKPVLGTLTVTGFLTLSLNFIKHNWL